MKRIFSIFVATIAMAMTAAAANVVTETTVWSFDDRAQGEVLEATIAEINGLYVRALPGHEAKIAGSRVRGKFSDGTQYKVKQGLSISSNPNLGEIGKIEADSKVGGRSDRCVAFQAGKAGKLYLAFRTKVQAEGRKLAVQLDGKTVADVEAAEVAEEVDNLGQMEVDIPAAGCVTFGGNAAYILVYMKYVPQE